MSTRSEMNGVFTKIETDISKTFADIETKYGYKLEFKGGSYDSEGNLNLKIVANRNGAKSEEQVHYDTNRMGLHLPPLATRIKIGGKEFVIVGLNKTCTKVKASWAGKTYLYPPEIIEAVWKMKNATPEVSV